MTPSNADLPKLFSDLVRLQIELWEAADRRLREAHDLPLTWFEPMQVVDRLGGGRVIDIAEELQISVGGSSKLVDRIESAGYLRRSPDPDDGRAMTVELTAAGRRKLRAAEKTHRAELGRLLGAGLSDRSLAQLANMIERLRAAQPSGGQGQ